MKHLTRVLAVVVSLFATVAGATKIPIPIEGSSLNLGIQLQPWILITQNAAPDAVSPNYDLFLRRARVVINGDAGQYFSYLVQFDNPSFGRRGNITGRAIIQDAWVGWAPTGISGPNVLYIDAGYLLLPISRHLLMTTTNFTTVDAHADSFRGMRETAAFRDLGVSLRGWALDKRIGFRGGIYEGVRGTTGAFDATNNPNAGLNPHGHPRLAGFVNFDLIGSEEGTWLYQGTLWAEKPVVSVGLGGVYQSLSTRGPNGITDSKMASADVFADFPFSSSQEIVFQTTGYRNDYGLGSKDTGWGWFADLGYRIRAFEPYVSYELFSGDACPTDAPAGTVCSQAQTADTRMFRIGLDYFINKNLNHVKAEFAIGRSLLALSKPSTWSITAQWNYNF